MKSLPYETSLASLWTDFLSLSRPLHPAVPVFSSFNVVHALRIGYVLRAVQKKQDGPSKRWSLAQEVVLSLVCMFGSLTMAQILLGMPALWLTNPGVPIPYLVLMTSIMHFDALFAIVDGIPVPIRAVIEVLVDGFGRIGGLTDLGVDLVANDPDTSLHNPFAMLFIATLVAGGGDIVLPSFSMLSVDWKPAAPPFTRMELSTDLWSCPVVAAFYASLTHAHPAFAQFSLFDKPVAADVAKGASAVLLCAILGSARLLAYLGAREEVSEGKEKSE